MVISLPVATYAGESAQAVPSGANYEFFVGIDVDIPLDAAELPMVDFRDNKVILWSRGKTTAQDSSKVKGVRFFRSPKLSRDFVEITDFSSTVVASNQDMTEDQMNTMLLQGMAEDNRDIAYGAAMFLAASKVGTSGTGGSSGAKLGSTPASSLSVNSLQSTGSGIGTRTSTANNTVNGVNETIDINYKVSSAEPIEDAYALILSVAKDEKNDANVEKWVRFHHIGRIDDTPKSFHVTQSGMPLNFELIGSHVFVFTHGEEIATSMSDMLVKLSAEDARRAINLCYVEGHKGMSLPPSLATVSIPDKIIGLIKDAGVSGVTTLHLDKDANVTSAECNGKPVSGAALNLLNTLIFHPRLKDGAPVEASVKINLEMFSEKNLKQLAGQ